MNYIERKYIQKYLKGFSTALVFLAFMLTACNFFDGATLPETPSLPDISEIPGIPDSLQDVPDLLEELDLPDLSNIANLPSLSDLPAFQSEPGTLNLRGPTDKKIGIGELIPGTDIQLVAVNDGLAEFTIDGLRLERTRGDSLDYVGPWPGAADVEYNLRLRIYNVSASNVRAAGVQQLIVPNISPTPAPRQLARIELKFPHTTSAGSGEIIDGTSFTYVGKDDRGAEIGGLPEGDYPYRKTGDSITWNGLLRADIPIEYRLRVLLTREESINVGGTVSVYLP